MPHGRHVSPLKQVETPSTMTFRSQFATPRSTESTPFGFEVLRWVIMWPRISTVNRALSSVTFSSRVRGISLKADYPSKNFLFYPAFFSEREQHLLLSASLARLDKTDTRQYRRKRKEFLARRTSEPSGVQDLFLPDDCYCFEEAGATKPGIDFHTF